MQLSYLLSPNALLGERRPVDLVKEGQIEKVLGTAALFGEHGAH
jgi:hypothetical protein